MLLDLFLFICYQIYFVTKSYCDGSVGAIVKLNTDSESAKKRHKNYLFTLKSFQKVFLSAYVLCVNVLKQ